MSRNFSKTILNLLEISYSKNFSNSVVRIIRRNITLLSSSAFAQASKVNELKCIALRVSKFSNVADAQTVAEKTAKKTEISFEELRDLVTASIGKIYDVREFDEIKESGMIATAVHLPLSKLKASLKMNEDEFAKMYTVSRPSEHDEIIFYAFSSVKSLSALEIAHKMGFKKARHYPGGFEDWLRKHSGH